jgi:hypothetical protein
MHQHSAAKANAAKSQSSMPVKINWETKANKVHAGPPA